MIKVEQWFRSSPEGTIVDFGFGNIRFQAEYLLFQVDRMYQFLGNAVWNGGAVQASHVVNWKVPLEFEMRQPEVAMKKQISHWRLPVEGTIGLQTAAKLTHASFAQLDTPEFRAICCTTVGTGNAVRAGQERVTFPGHVFGTVNCIALIDGRLTDAALANLLITITEAKTAALQDAGILDRNNGLPATGTTTDAVVVGVSQSRAFRHVHRYAGTATELGHAIEMMVYRAVMLSTATQAEA